MVGPSRSLKRQRQDLNPVEEALAFQMLVQKFKISQAEVARIVGKERATISNAIRLLKLDEEVLDALREGEISAGHGRALLRLDDESLQRRVARRVIKNGLSVRATEALIDRLEEEEYEPSEEELKELASLQRLEKKVGNLLDVEMVSVHYDSQGRKRLQLTFDTEAAWRRFMGRIRE